MKGKVLYFICNYADSQVFLPRSTEQEGISEYYMDDGSRMPLLGLMILVILILLNGILYGFAAAVRGLSENEIRKMTEEGNKKAALLNKLTEEPARYINAIPLVVTASGILTGILIPSLTGFLHHYIKHFPVLVPVYLLCAVFLASFGILMFRRIGTCRPHQYAFRYVRLVYGLVTLLYPVTRLITWFARMAAGIFGVSVGEEQEAVTEEEIISIVDEAHEQGVIEKNEAEMIQNIISFTDTKAGDIMTHRSSVVAFGLDELLKDVVDRMLEEGDSRYPVYGEDMDDIRGIIHYKDTLKFMTQNAWARYKPLGELPGLIRKAAFAPETGSISNLFKSMQAKHDHIAVVVDEYGQTAGIVTMEDILEEIVGDILDEYDEDEDAIRTQTDNSVLIDGFAELEDVGEKLGIDFGDVEMETLNGFLTEMLGHIPADSDLDSEITAFGYRFKILSLGNRTIGKVRAEKINDKDTKGESKQCQDIQNSQT